ncbi:MAG: hypothetical protein K9J06_02195 [Flavobacteriales bacterium]|nr:hypothetical protein [Flavobacteriales bacterium]
MKNYTPKEQKDGKGFNEVPSEEETSRYKDFGKLVYNHQRMTKPLYKKPIYKDKRAFLVILLILLVLFVLLGLD